VIAELHALLAEGPANASTLKAIDKLVFESRSARDQLLRDLSAPEADIIRAQDTLLKLAGQTLLQHHEAFQAVFTTQAGSLYVMTTDRSYLRLGVIDPSEDPPFAAARLCIEAPDRSLVFLSAKRGAAFLADKSPKRWSALADSAVRLEPAVGMCPLGIPNERGGVFCGFPWGSARDGPLPPDRTHAD
jgi:hypothetical protein